MYKFLAACFLVAIVTACGRNNLTVDDSEPSDVPPNANQNANGEENPLPSEPINDNPGVLVRIDVEVPDSVATSTVFNLDTVYPVIRLADDRQVAMNCCETGSTWKGSFLAERGIDQTVSATWYEVIDNDILKLTRKSQNFTLSSETPMILMTSNSYSTVFDADGDGIDNITERLENTDPFPIPGNNIETEPVGVDVVIPKIFSANAPIIDGAGVDYQEDQRSLAGEWSVSVQSDLNGNRLSIDNTMIDNTGNVRTKHNHHWAAAHDGTYLYVLVISDDAGLSRSDSNDPAKAWKDDGMEIYFDGNNSKLPSYDGVDDFQLSINLLKPLTQEPNRSATSNVFQQSVNSATLPTDLTFAAGLRAGPTSPRPGAGKQDIYEIRIKISELNINGSEPFGIEVQINDDDTGGDRDSKWGWKHPTGVPGAEDQTWENPSLMGTAVLQQ